MASIIRIVYVIILHAPRGRFGVLRPSACSSTRLYRAVELFESRLRLSVALHTTPSAWRAKSHRSNADPPCGVSGWIPV